MHNTSSAQRASSLWSGRDSLGADGRLVLARLASSRVLPQRLVRTGRSQAIAAIVGHAGAGLHADVLALVADAGLVLFAVDDLLDGDELTPEEGALRVAQYTAVARGERCPEVAFDPIARALADLRARLSALDLDGDLLHLWSDATARMLQAMGAELRRDELASADLDAYLAIGRDSIGVEMIAFTAWIALGAAPTYGMLAGLRGAERHLSTAVRLANDLRTRDRERAEGRVNAVTLVGDEGVPLLRDLCARHLAEGRDALGRAGLWHTPQGRFLERFASAIVSMYETRDFLQVA